MNPTTQASSLYAKVEEVVGAQSSQVDQGSKIKISMDQRNIKMMTMKNNALWQWVMIKDANNDSGGGRREANGYLQRNRGSQWQVRLRKCDMDGIVINDSRYVASIQQDFSEDPPYSPPNSGFKVQNLRNKQQNQVSSSLSSYMLSKQKSDGRLSAISTSGGPLSWLRSTSCWSTDGLHKSQSGWFSTLPSSLPLFMSLQADFI